MREITLKIGIKVFEFLELPKADQELVAMAVRARDNVQAPYSKYCVGAAAQFEDGLVSPGVNVETASYTQTTHAEQGAIVGAVARHGARKLTDMAIVGAPGSKKIMLPPVISGKRIESVHDLCPSCGHCLQIIWEQCGGDRGVRLLSLHTSGEIGVTTIGDAFPMAFGPTDLGINVFAKQS